jgi:hypothetical protein
MAPMTRDRTYRPHFMTHRRVENPDDPACTALYCTAAAAAAAPPPPPPVKLKYSKLPEGRRASCCDRARTGRVGGHGDFGRPGTRIIHQMMQKSRPIFSKRRNMQKCNFLPKSASQYERMLILLNIPLIKCQKGINN